MPAHTDLADTVGGSEDGDFTDSSHTEVRLTLWNTLLGSGAQGRHTSQDSLISSWAAVQDGSNVKLTVALNQAVPGWVVGIAPGVGEIQIGFSCTAP
jgi:hypothetical protein